MNVQNDRGVGKGPECKEQRHNERHKRLEALRVKLPTGSLNVYNSWSVRHAWYSSGVLRRVTSSPGCSSS